MPAGALRSFADRREYGSAAWEAWLAQLADAGVPPERVVFTEIGIRAQRGAHRRPYVRLVGEIGGVYWWMVDFDYPDEAAEPESFSPLGKPAADVVTRCFERALG